MDIINKPISVIIDTDEKGNIKPMRFRIIDEEGEPQVYDIIGVLSTEDIKIAGVRYRTIECKTIINNVMRNVQLRMDIDSCKWMLHKM